MTHTNQQPDNVKQSDNLFIPIPGRIFNDFETGKMTLNMWGVYSVILRQLNFDTGIWRGTAYKICAAWGDRIPLRTIQENLRNLCDAHYVKSFHVQGQRGGYVIAVEGYRIRFGTKEGHILNAMATTDPNNPVYEYLPVRTSKEKTGVKPPSVRRQRAISAASVQDQCAISAPSPGPNARIPDVPEGLDGADGPDGQTVHPSRAQSAGSKLDGWLAGRISSILQKKAGTVIVPTKDERQKLNALAAKEGHLSVLLGFYHFAERDRKLYGLAYPISMFISQAEQWIEHAVQEKQEHTKGIIETVSTMLDEYEIAGSTLWEPLCELSYLESDLNGESHYDPAIVAEYLDIAYERVQPEPAAVAEEMTR
jgi:hypothetical protein